MKNTINLLLLTVATAGYCSIYAGGGVSTLSANFDDTESEIEDEQNKPCEVKSNNSTDSISSNDSVEEQNNRFLLAVQNNNPSKMMSALEKGAQLDALDAQGNSALLIAATHGNNEILDILLKHHADTTVKNNRGDTALHCAAQSECGSLMMVTMLYRNGANIFAINNAGKTAKDVAKKGATKRYLTRQEKATKH